MPFSSSGQSLLPPRGVFQLQLEALARVLVVLRLRRLSERLPILPVRRRHLSRHLCSQGGRLLRRFYAHRL